MRVDGIEPQLPDVDAAYLASYLFEIGPTMSGNMGEAPLSCLEIQSWQQQTGIDLQPWEFRALRKLSQDYLSESYLAGKPDCPAPYQPNDLTEQNRAAVAKKVRNEMRAYLIAQEGK